MPEIKIGDDVILHGKVKEIIINVKETLYKVIINEKDAPNSMYNEVIIRPRDIVE